MEKKKILNSYRDWKDFSTNNSVGIITTLLSEQLLSHSLNVKSLSFDNYVEEIELYEIDTVFIDNDLYENDHSWFKRNRGLIVNHLKNNGINLVVIKNTTLDVSPVFKNAFLMQLNSEVGNYKINNGILDVPLLINTDSYNPINSQKNTDIIYFSIG